MQRHAHCHVLSIAADVPGEGRLLLTQRGEGSWPESFDERLTLRMQRANDGTRGLDRAEHYRKRLTRCPAFGFVESLNTHRRERITCHGVRALGRNDDELMTPHGSDGAIDPARPFSWISALEPRHQTLERRADTYRSRPARSTLSVTSDHSLVAVKTAGAI